MMKKLTCLLLALVMVFSFAACRSSAPETPSNEPSESANTPDDNQGDVEPYKIAIYTGTVSQGEEEYQAAQKMAATYTMSLPQPTPTTLQPRPRPSSPTSLRWLRIRK